VEYTYPFESVQGTGIKNLQKTRLEPVEKWGNARQFFCARRRLEFFASSVDPRDPLFHFNRFVKSNKQTSAQDDYIEHLSARSAKCRAEPNTIWRSTRSNDTPCRSAALVQPTVQATVRNAGADDILPSGICRSWCAAKSAPSPLYGGQGA
jgi:hypothetical protein